MGAADAPALAAPTGGGAAGVELERRVMAAVKASEARGDPPLLRAVEVARLVAGEGAGLPSADLAWILVSNLCFAHNSASLWKLVDQAMSSRLLCPLHVLALLTARSAVPGRRLAARPPPRHASRPPPRPTPLLTPPSPSRIELRLRRSSSAAARATPRSSTGTPPPSDLMLLPPPPSSTPACSSSSLACCCLQAIS